MSNTFRHICAWAAALLVATSASKAQTASDIAPLRPVTSAYMFEIGNAQLADTYLTPLFYHGTRLAFAYERTQAMRFSPDRWIMQLAVSPALCHTQNPAKNAKMADLGIAAHWGMMRRWQPAANLWVGIGGDAGLDAGVLYLSRNGNNPASAKAAVTVGAKAYASWRHKVWRVPFTLRYQASMPAAGAFFSPEYAQLYYQIYLGDRDNLAHFAWWGSYMSLNSLLTADLHFGATTLRLGYRFDVLSTKANKLVTRDVSHSFVIGFTTDCISINRGKGIPRSRIIYAY